MSVQPHLIGLTGGIGSGKSTVAAMLQKLGASIVDADTISRSTTAAHGEAIAAICAAFGNDFLDAAGALNRSKMRDLVFANSHAKKKLETIIHPIIQAKMELQIAKSTSELVVLDLPLLAERSGFMGWRPQLATICVVDCNEDVQIQRVVQRNQMTPEQVRIIMSNQASRQARLAIADIVIDNSDCTLKALGQQVESVFAKLQ